MCSGCPMVGVEGFEIAVGFMSTGGGGVLETNVGRSGRNQCRQKHFHCWRRMALILSDRIGMRVRVAGRRSTRGWLRS